MLDKQGYSAALNDWFHNNPDVEVQASTESVWGKSNVWGASNNVWGASSNVWGASSNVWGASSNVWGASNNVWGARQV